jgi:hypothetical protein
VCGDTVDSGAASQARTRGRWFHPILLVLAWLTVVLAVANWLHAQAARRASTSYRVIDISGMPLQRVEDTLNAAASERWVYVGSGVADFSYLLLRRDERAR